MLESNQNTLEGADAERLRASLLSDDINEVVGSLDVFNGSMSDSSKSEGGE
jgi:hypothetical protein